MCMQVEMSSEEQVTAFGNTDLLVCFEFAHLTIFGMALLTIIQGAYFMAILTFTSRRWDAMSSLEPGNLVKELETQSTCCARGAGGGTACAAAGAASESQSRPQLPSTCCPTHMPSS